MRKSSSIVLVVILATLMIGSFFLQINGLDIPTDRVFALSGKDLDNFSISKLENDSDDFKTFIVSEDESTVYFKAHYFPNQVRLKIEWN